MFGTSKKTVELEQHINDYRAALQLRISGRDYYGAAIGKGNVVERHSGPLGFRVEVTLPKVTNLCISGAGDVTYRDVDQDDLSLDVSGAGTIEVADHVPAELDRTTR